METNLDSAAEAPARLPRLTFAASAAPGVGGVEIAPNAFDKSSGINFPRGRRLTEFAGDDGKLHARDLTDIATRMEEKDEIIRMFKRFTIGLGVLVVLVAIVLGSTTAVVVQDSIREPTTVSQPATDADTAATLTSPAGVQVEVAQSGDQVMLGMLVDVISSDPLQAIKAMPQSIVVWHAIKLGWIALKPISVFLSQTATLAFKCESGEHIVVHDEMHGSVFQDQAQLTIWDELVANGAAPAYADDNSTERFHFCAACVPVELKSLLSNDRLDRAFASFDNATKDSSCDDINGAHAFAANLAEVLQHQMGTSQRMTYTPEVCVATAGSRTRREANPTYDEQRRAIQEGFARRTRRYHVWNHFECDDCWQKGDPYEDGWNEDGSHASWQDSAASPGSAPSMTTLLITALFAAAAAQ